MAWQINILGRMPTGLPKIRPRKPSRLLGRIQSLPLRISLWSSCSPLLRPTRVTFRPLCLGPRATSGKYRASWGPPHLINQGSVLASRLCPVEGEEKEREEKRFPPYCSAAGKSLSSVLPFIC